MFVFNLFSVWLTIFYGVDVQNCTSCHIDL